MPPPLLIDLETRSACDLKEHGGFVYAADPSTRLLTVSWSEDGGDTIHIWTPGCDTVPPDAAATPDVIWHPGAACPLHGLTDRPWVAHNAWTFDRIVWAADKTLPQPVKWIDTYPLALAAGLPGSLDQIGVRLWGEGKMKEGSSALKRHTKAADADDADPRNVPPGITWLIGRYNVQDVRLLGRLMAEVEESLAWTSDEMQVLNAHDMVNSRGVRLDVGLINAIKALSQESVRHAVAEIAALTSGALPDLASLRQRNRVMDWLERHGIRFVGDGGKKTLRREIISQWLDTIDDTEDADGQPLSDGGDPDGGASLRIDTKSIKLCARVLKLRNAAMRITEGKLDAALARMSPDGRLRGLFAYHGSHTGRWAGRGIQVQNLTRPKKGVPVWDLLRTYDATGRLEYPAVQWMNQMGAWEAGKDTPLPMVDDASAGLLRGIFLPDKGDECILAADLSNIESRVLGWLAGEETMMAAFVRGECPYSLMASKLYGRPVKDKKDPIRQVGKVIVLGCGYGLGETKFALYGASSGIDFEEQGITPFECVDAFRTSFPAIAGRVMGEFEGRKWRRGGFWNDLNDVSLEAVRNPGREFALGRLTFEMRRGHLYVILPSGRSLCYRQAREVEAVTWWGKTAASVEYQSPRFRATRLYGGKWAENIVQAVSRDFLAASLVTLRDTAVLHVHDEIVCSGNASDLPRFMKAFTTPPSWALGLPLDAEGGIMPRYAKTPPSDWPKEQLWRNGEKVS